MNITEFEHGALIAISTIVGAHDQPDIAADVVLELGLQNADCSELSEYDKKNLAEAQSMRTGISFKGI